MKNNIQVVNFDTCIKPARTSVLPLKTGQTFSAVSRERHPMIDNIPNNLRSFIFFIIINMFQQFSVQHSFFKISTHGRLAEFVVLYLIS